MKKRVAEGGGAALNFPQWKKEGQCAANIPRGLNVQHQQDCGGHLRIKAQQNVFEFPDVHEARTEKVKSRRKP